MDLSVSLGLGTALLIGVGVWALFRSLRRWQQPPPGRDADARQAEARLWATRNVGGR